MSQPKKSSSLPTILIVVACASVASYFAFFRGKESPTMPTPKAAAETPERTKAPLTRNAGKPAPTPPKAAAAPAPGKIKTPPPKPAPAPKLDARQEIRALCARKQWREAAAKLGPIFADEELSDADRAEFVELGIKMNKQILQYQPDGQDVLVYEIRQGDSLEGIARKHKKLRGVKGSIMLVNNYKENQILKVGRRVRVARGTWSLVVDKSLFQLYICYEGVPFKAYSIAIGTDEKTPAGVFEVGTKNPKPAWWPPADLGLAGPVPYGDAQNPLGEYWIGLDHDFFHGLGIHGTNDPGSIGSKTSNGCVRMLNHEVMHVAAISYRGMKAAFVE